MTDHFERGSALEKALLVVDAVVSKDQPVGLAYLTGELDLPKPTIHRVLAQLERAGLVQRAPGTERYVVGSRLNRLSARTLGSLNQGVPTRAILDSLVVEIGETCNIGMLDQHQVTYLDRVECDSHLRVNLARGSRVPAHCTAIGKLLLAHLPAAARDRLLAVAPLKRYTANTIVERREFERELQRIRVRGFSINDQEYVVGMIAMAVPIRAGAECPVAALAVHAPTPRLTLKGAVARRAALQAAADRVATAWGLGGGLAEAVAGR